MKTWRSEGWGEWEEWEVEREKVEAWDSEEDIIDLE